MQVFRQVTEGARRSEPWAVIDMTFDGTQTSVQIGSPI
jgi:hypothetical protein